MSHAAPLNPEPSRSDAPPAPNRRRRPRRRDGRAAGSPALPPGQHVPTFRPVQDRGIRPSVPREQWELRIDGDVTRELRLDWADWSTRPRAEVRADLHCVTSWSLVDQRFEGVRLAELLRRAEPEAGADHLLVTARDGFTTNLSLDVALADDVLLVDRWNGRPLSRDHGAPVRLVVPSRYGYKSAKWIERITLSKDLLLGFQESRGHHPDGDPWKEERFA